MIFQRVPRHLRALLFTCRCDCGLKALLPHEKKEVRTARNARPSETKPKFKVLTWRPIFGWVIVRCKLSDRSSGTSAPRIYFDTENGLNRMESRRLADCGNGEFEAIAHLSPFVRQVRFTPSDYGSDTTIEEFAIYNVPRLFVRPVALNALVTYHPDYSRQTSSEVRKKLLSQNRDKGNSLDDLLDAKIQSLIGQNVNVNQGDLLQSDEEISSYLDGCDLEVLNRLNPFNTETISRNTIYRVFNESPVPCIRFSEDDRENSKIYQQIGRRYENNQEIDQANEFYYLSCYFGYADGSVYESLANWQFNNRRFRLASLHYEKATTLRGVTAWAFINLAKCYSKLGKFDRAIATIVRAREYDPALSAVFDAADEIVEELWNHGSEDTKFFACQNRRTELVNISHRIVERIALTYATLFNQCGQIKEHELNLERLLIIGDHHIPQCIRYRINQKREQLEELGVNVTVVNWTDSKALLPSINFNDIIIFYRVPAVSSLIKAIEYAKSLNKIVIYEIDDLIFDKTYPIDITSYGGQVGIYQYHSLTAGALLFREAAKLCDYGIVPTPSLQQQLSGLVRSNVCYLHRNGLDTLLSGKKGKRHDHNHNRIIVFYGSGTLAHNSDFIKEVLPAIDALMDQHDSIVFHCVGYLKLPSKFRAKYGERVVQDSFTTDITDYYQHLSNSDINLAVLSEDLINDCKSEIKWMEAGFFAVPSVVSSTETYRQTINSGVDGLIAKDPSDWQRKLEMLITDRKKRTALGRNARTRIMNEYSVKIMAENLQAIIQDIQSRREH